MPTTLDIRFQENMIKRLLRRQNTRQYFADDGWTENPDKAKSFSDVVEAAETCVRFGLSDVELALRVNSRACDLFCTSVR